MEGVQLSVIAQQFLCVFLTRLDAEFESDEVVSGLLKSVRPMPGRLFDSLLAQLRASETEERLVSFWEWNRKFSSGISLSLILP